MKPLLMIVPTRSRPHAIEPVVTAWLDTGGFLAADLLFAVDRDDPAYEDYFIAIEQQADRAVHFDGSILVHTLPQHQSLVPKLDSVAAFHAEYMPKVEALGFAGDDHLPRTKGWSQRYVAELRRLGTGIIYPDDGYQHDRLSTTWAMTVDIVRALDRMVPAPVEHLYCDNAVMDLGNEVNCLTYLPDVLFEHMHPAANKARLDAQYQRVNSREQYRKDFPAYRAWRRGDGMARDVGLVRDLIRNRGEKP